MSLPPDLYYFPFAEYWWMYVVFTALISVLLALDLGVFNKTPHAISIREATMWTIVWALLALAFNVGLYYYASWRLPTREHLMAIPGFSAEAAARQIGLEFLAGYLIERALSFDNIFVFVVVFTYFQVPSKLQHRVLFYGIIGAFVFRAIFIGMGALLMRFHYVVIFFGVVLLVTGVRMAFGPESSVDPENNIVIKWMRRFLPVTTEGDGDKFFVRLNGVLHGTPLFVALVFLEITDVVFAVDSVPAVFAMTKEPLIVFTSNIFAILGLRAMYFMLAGAMDKFWLLKYGLSAVLVFVGLKMVWWNGVQAEKLPITLSLGVILMVLVVSVTASWMFPRERFDGPAPS